MRHVFVPLWEYTKITPVMCSTLEEAMKVASSMEYEEDDMGNWIEDTLEIHEILEKDVPYQLVCGRDLGSTSINVYLV